MRKSQAQVDKTISLIDKQICPHCKGKLIQDHLDRECPKCKILFKFMDDPGPGGYGERKIR